MAIRLLRWLLIDQCLQTVQRGIVVNALLTATPADTNATLGSHVRLLCSTDAKREINWQYGVDLLQVTDVYIANEGLVGTYKKSNRYSIDMNTTTGQYDLVISNVTEEDDGFYICSEPTGWGTPPHARLIVTGSDLSAKVCRSNVVAIKGGELQLSFSTCSPEPFYLSHVPVGESHSIDVYNLQKLLNGYAESGRFTVERGSEGLTLKITNVQISDAGTFACRGNSGRGERHNKEVVVLEGMPTCADNISNAECIAETGETTEVNCAVNYTGSCAPYSAWYYEHGIKINASVKQEFTNFDKTYSMVELKAIVTIKNGTRLVCQLENPSSGVTLEYLCNTSIVPEQCGKHQGNGTSEETTPVSSNTTLIVVLVILLVVVGLFITCVVYRKFKKRHRKPDDDNPEVAVPMIGTKGSINK